MIGFLIMGIVALSCIVIGCLIWKKQKISLLHDYHYDKVSEEDKKAFCAISGAGITVIGFGILISVILLACTNSLWSFLPFVAGFMLGLSLLIFAGNTYNRKKPKS